MVGYSAQIQVTNTFFESKPSEIVDFDMPEGGEQFCTEFLLLDIFPLLLLSSWTSDRFRGNCVRGSNGGH